MVVLHKREEIVAEHSIDEDQKHEEEGDVDHGRERQDDGDDEAAAQARSPARVSAPLAVDRAHISVPAQLLGLLALEKAENSQNPEHAHHTKEHGWHRQQCKQRFCELIDER